MHDGNRAARCSSALAFGLTEGANVRQFRQESGEFGSDLMSQVQLKDLLDISSGEGVASEISERLSQELVITLVGPVASGVSTAANFIHEILTQVYGYKVAPIIRPSEIIKSEMHRVGMSPPPINPLGVYIDQMQTAGNKLRERFGTNYLAEKCIEKIVAYRTEKGGYSQDHVPLPGRRAYIIDSIKNKEELELFRRIYGETLCLFGVFAPDELRRQRLQNNGTKSTDIQKILDRDQGEVMTFGQMTRKIFVESDFFICNDQKPEELRRQIFRFLEIVFDTGIHTPTQAEAAMYKADAVASNSACMSRQVGAAIVGANGELIAVGWNDVPKFGGHLYSEDDQTIWNSEKQRIEDRDHRCFKWENRICHNETRRQKIIDDIVKKVFDSGLLKRGKAKADVRALLEGTDVDSLIEFSRAIHAEMEAILSVAREGRHSLRGSVLYTTTYPCHNCARHIVAAGIREVIYIQPYLKSLAIALHKDAITETRDDRSRVLFRQFDGVAPRNYLRLFQPKAPRKKAGVFYRASPTNALPVFRIPLDSQVEYESKIIADLSTKEQDRLMS